MKSGNSYTLSDLFSEDRKIIIPDLQRDYCWGNKQYDLVSSFIDNLIEADWGNELMLGLIYGYEHPKNHIQLCDGQQRLTTLFLLLGMLNKYCKGNPFSDKLISKFELDDDKEPYLLYSIRESTLYFLSDLVTEFFLKEGDSVKDITQKDWYFKDYAQDPSISSMINALEIIENKLKSIENKSEFGYFILNNLKFLYYDMQNRQNGEETFVIINTTGEPLTATENLKPILLGNINDPNEREKQSNLWEERETWFWQNRKSEEQEGDNGLKDFLTWYLRIRNKQEEIGEITKRVKEDVKSDGLLFLENLEKAFNSVKKLIELLENDKIQGQFKFINENKEIKGISGLRDLDKDRNRNIVLPLLFFITKISSEWDDVYLFLRRLKKNYFDNKEPCRKHNYIDWRYILQIIEKEDTLNSCLNWEKPFEKIGNLEIPNGIWYNNEEQLKTRIKSEKINEIEDIKEFMGDLSPLFRYILVFNNEIKVVNEYQSLNNFFDKINISDTEKVFLLNQKDLFEQLETTFKLYQTFFINDNIWIDILNIRFWKNDSLWEGNWKFRRLDNRFTYRRWSWNNKRHKYFYQDWTYYLLNLLKNMEEGQRVSILEKFCLGFLEQYDEKFFSSKFIVSEKVIDSSIFYESISKYKDTADVNNYYFWLGYLWTVWLGKTRGKTPEYDEIIFDVFFDDTDLKNELGNQFLWCKDWGRSAIKLHDNFEGLSWNKHLGYQDKPQEFIKNRETFIKNLLM